jgi:hypothetical protein
LEIGVERTTELQARSTATLAYGQGGCNVEGADGADWRVNR